MEQQQQMDPQALMSRAGDIAKEIRRSEAYPALLGGIAGGIAGGLIAAIIAGRASSGRVTSARNVVADTVASIKKESQAQDGGWSVREVIQLATVLAGLAKQVQAMIEERRQAA